MYLVYRIENENTDKPQTDTLVAAFEDFGVADQFCVDSNKKNENPSIRFIYDSITRECAIELIKIAGI